jgi:predicted amidohydrolase
VCVPYDVAANADAHAAAVRAAGARLVVFPELSLTGYELDAPPLDADDGRLAPIVGACAATGAVALVGAPLRGEAGRAHIAMLAVDGDGVTVAYRKVWVADLESAWFRPGPRPAVLEVGGWRLGLAICRDAGIARHTADLVGLGIDAWVAGTVMFPDETATQDERTRRVAAEHGIWALVASFAGPTGGGYTRTAGHSGIWAPGGTLAAQAGPEPGAIATATLSR